MRRVLVVREFRIAKLPTADSLLAFARSANRRRRPEAFARARDRSGTKTRRVFVGADSPVPAAGGDAPIY
jgi:hypothetical protein